MITRKELKSNIDRRLFQMISKQDLKASIERHLHQTLARDKKSATPRDWWLASCCAINDHILQRLSENQAQQKETDVKRVYYFSLEYLIGRLLNTNADNLDFRDVLAAALEDFGQSYEALRCEEVDMGLGNGGLGRLAACFLDSLATLDYPAVGYGILYEFGLFKQKIINHRQEEFPETWLKFGNPWRILRADRTQMVDLYGHLENVCDSKGDVHSAWVGCKTLLGIPWDVPIVGYRGKTVNYLRLWESRASEEFDLKTFNEGGYVQAVQEKVIGETISKVLYPNDRTENGKELRLVQQYFFVSCSLKDIIRRYKVAHKNWNDFPKKVVIQLNDTHPAIAVPELMRLLIDEEGMPWAKAWKLCRSTFAYTNHTLLPEALERWSVPLMQKVLPRHLQIIYEINQWFLDNDVEKKWPGDDEMKRQLSLIEEGDPKYVRMAYLSVVASFSVNGVARLHSELLKTKLFAGFHALYPTKFNNKTNGVTPRRWIKTINPRLSQLISQALGHDRWLTDLEQLRDLEAHVENDQFLREFAAVKLANKYNLARYIEETCQVRVNPEALFDVQIKRIHEYKRQHLNLLHCLKLYHDLLHGKKKTSFKRVVLFAGKAAPEYHMAKEIIHGINLLAHHVNSDQRIQDALKIVFLPNYNITLAGKIIPAADLSEQISTAGKEASGTGNMKLGLNGACTIGTLDGANVEMAEKVGEENIFIFGHTVEEIDALRQSGYNPYAYYENDPELRAILDWMDSDFFTDNNHNPMRVLRNCFLQGGDPFFVLADFRSYCKVHETIETVFRQNRLWTQKAMLNTARLGYFSSDRTIHDYVKDIWKL